MPNHKSIVVVAAVESRQAERVVRLSKSIRDHLPSFSLEVEVLVFNHFNDQDLDDCLLGSGVKVFYKTVGVLPIVQSRNKCQSHLLNRLQDADSFGMVLDDDLLWNMKEKEFVRLLNLLSLRKADMAIMGLDGDAPIPKEYVRASPLLDILISIKSIEVSSFLSNVTIAPGAGRKNSHHDYYSFNKELFNPYECTMDNDEFISNIFHGKTTTRKLDPVQGVDLSSGRERGGATLIMNPKVLTISNTSINVCGYVSRRSDMAMGVSSKNIGFNVYKTKPVLSHVREDSFDSHSPEKLISDILGYAYVESLSSPSKFLDVLIERIDRSRLIIEETSTMLTLLADSIELSKKSHDYISLMLDENSITLRKIEEFRLGVYYELSTANVDSLSSMMTG